MRTPLRATVVPALVAALVVTSASAGADVTKAECIAANTAAQDLRRDGKLSAAREQLRKCVDPSCPGMVLDDCSRRLDELDKMQPTVVFEVKDAAGHDLSAVKVTVDGKSLVDKLDGSDLPVDPGEHVFTFTIDGQAPVSRTLVLSAGEKARREQVVIGGPSAGRLARLLISAEAGAMVSVDGHAVGTGRFEGTEPPGLHEVSITAPGMRPYQTEVDLRAGETSTLSVTLEAEKKAAVWPWIVGGAALAAGAVMGGYFLFKSSSPGATTPPPDQLGSLQLMAWGR
jgi:hypothetical protein